MGGELFGGFLHPGMQFELEARKARQDMEMQVAHSLARRPRIRLQTAMLLSNA